MKRSNKVVLFSALGIAILIGGYYFTVNFIDKQCFASRIDDEVSALRMGTIDPAGLEKKAKEVAGKILISYKRGESMCTSPTGWGRMKALIHLARGQAKILKRKSIIGCVAHRAWAEEYSPEDLAAAKKWRSLKRLWYDVTKPPKEGSCAAYTL